MDLTTVLVAVVAAVVGAGLVASFAWALLRRTDRAQDAFPGVLTACEQEGDLRTVTFAAGMSVQERIVDVDDTRRRLAYAIVGRGFDHHSASMQALDEGEGCSRFLWTTDFIGEAPMLRPLMEQGAEAFARAVAA